MLEVLRHSVMITGFVFVMMLVIEYLNVLTSGAWQKELAKNRWSQYILAAGLGAVPGCLGAFAVVAMYSHGLLGLGAVVAAMVATSGDEAFLMIAMIPRQAVLITAALFVAGVAAGMITDVVSSRLKLGRLRIGCELELHDEFSDCGCFPRGEILRQWKECSAARGILVFLLVAIIVAIATGQIGPGVWNWIRVTLLVASIIALFIVSTVHDHFLEEHLWSHIAKKHIPRIFLWTLGVLVFIHMITDYLHYDLAADAGGGRWIVLVFACLLGLIPQSGPHLVFLTLYAKGALPLGILLANSVVQDGHGMLPLLAQSRHAFIVIKLINLAAGLLIGAAVLSAGR